MPAWSAEDTKEVLIRATLRVISEGYLKEILDDAKVCAVAAEIWQNERPEQPRSFTRGAITHLFGNPRGLLAEARRLEYEFLEASAWSARGTFRTMDVGVRDDFDVVMRRGQLIVRKLYMVEQYPDAQVGLLGDIERWLLHLNETLIDRVVNEYVDTLLNMVVIQPFGSKVWHEVLVRIEETLIMAATAAARYRTQVMIEEAKQVH